MTDSGGIQSLSQPVSSVTLTGTGSHSGLGALAQACRSLAMMLPAARRQAANQPASLQRRPVSHGKSNGHPDGQWSGDTNFRVRPGPGARAYVGGQAALRALPAARVTRRAAGVPAPKYGQLPAPNSKYGQLLQIMDNSTPINGGPPADLLINQGV